MAVDTARELTAFYDSLSRYLTEAGHGAGGADSYAMHRMLRDPAGRREAPDPQVLDELVAAEIVARDARTVLDAGCGWGGTLLHLARAHGIAGTGITLSAVQAERAARAARSFGLANRLAFVRGDYTRHRFPAATFDAVVAIESLIHCTGKAEAVRHLAAALRPGGQLLLVDDMSAAPAGAGGADLDRFRRLWRLPDTPAAGEWLAIFQQAGLRGEIVRDLTPLYSPRPDGVLDALTEEAGRELAALGRSRAGRRPALEAIVGGYLLEKLYNRGAMRYAMLRAVAA